MIAGERDSTRRSLVGGSGLLLLVVVLSVATLGVKDETAPVTGALPAASPATRPLDVVTSSISRGLASLCPRGIGVGLREKRGSELRDTTVELFDVNDMARRALGPHWKGLEPREHEEFVRLFADVLTQAFGAIVQRHTLDDVVSLGEAVAGPLAQVRLRIAADQGPATAIEYRLLQRGSRWTVYDIVLDGASLISSYRSQFNSIIGTSTVAQLLERMRTAASRRPSGHDAAGAAATAEVEASTPERLAAVLLLSGASHPRGR
jgi:phospholipid transport system substrate-binding protein